MAAARLRRLPRRVRDAPAQCQAFDITFPRPDGRGLHRRALLGPVGHMAIEASGEEEHPFCACCFPTKSFETFRPLLQAGLEFRKQYVILQTRGQPAA